MRAVLTAAAGVLVVGLAACTPQAGSSTASAATAETTPPPAQVTEEDQQLLATVEDVDMQSRMLTLRRTDGMVEKLYVPAEVKNLPQVRVGDHVVASYAASLTAAKATGTPKAVADQSVTTAPMGSKPRIATNSSVTTVVTVDSYDPTTHMIAFTGPNGVQRTAQLRNSDMKNLAGTLKKGDQVEVTYSEVTALAIQHPTTP
jgi:hypothetical protein